MPLSSIPLAKIRRDGGTQSRAVISDEVVADYQVHVRALPPVVVFFDRRDYWLADGFHRVEAHARAGERHVICDVRNGTLRDAILFAAGANADVRALRRSNPDKRRAVELLLFDEEWRQWSDGEIARACAVDHKTVGNIRRELYAAAQTVRRVKRGGKEYSMRVSGLLRERDQGTVAVETQSCGRRAAARNGSPKAVGTSPRIRCPQCGHEFAAIV